MVIRSENLTWSRTDSNRNNLERYDSTMIVAKRLLPIGWPECVATAALLALLFKIFYVFFRIESTECVSQKDKIYYEVSPFNLIRPVLL